MSFQGHQDRDWCYVYSVADELALVAELIFLQLVRDGLPGVHLNHFCLWAGN
jgi:hypothetical protein